MFVRRSPLVSLRYDSIPCLLTGILSSGVQAMSALSAVHTCIASADQCTVSRLVLALTSWIWTGKPRIPIHHLRKSQPSANVHLLQAHAQDAIRSSAAKAMQKSPHRQST